MTPEFQFLFFLVASLCFFMAAFKENWPPHWRMTHQRYTALGWLFFAVPFAYNAAVAAW